MTRGWLWLVPVCTAVVLLPDGTLQQFLSILAPTSGPTWWLVSVLLAVGFVAGGFRLMRALDVPGALLPAAVVVAVTGSGGPLAPRAADGPSGAGYGMEPLALCLLIWCYDAFVRNHAIRAGVLLGAAGIAHPLTFAHGLLVLLIATPFLEPGRWNMLSRTSLIALAVGAPAVLQLVVSAVDLIRMDPAEGSRLIAEGYRFRFPSWFALEGLRGAAGVTRLLLVSAGIVGAAAVIMRAPNARSAARAIVGLIGGHMLLLVIAAFCYTSRVPGPWSRSVTPYALDLTLTAPLLPMLAAISLFASIEAVLMRAGRFEIGRRGLTITLLASAFTLSIWSTWTAWTAVAVGLGIATLVALRMPRAKWLAAVSLAAAVIVGLGWSYRHTVRPVTVDTEDEELYQWARTTPKRSLFIVPPTARAFRYYTRKGVVVDYDLVPPANPRGLRAWRDRLDAIAQPDDRVDGYPAWRRPHAMDRAYAIANTPARAAELLRQFKVQYLVWDARGLDIPPHLPVSRPPHADVTEAFRNTRYVVYGLAHPDSER